MFFLAWPVGKVARRAEYMAITVKAIKIQLASCVYTQM